MLNPETAGAAEALKEGCHRSGRVDLEHVIEVADVDAARSYVAQGFVVHVLNDDGSLSPLPEAEPAQEVAEEAPKAKRRKSEG